MATNIISNWPSGPPIWQKDTLKVLLGQPASEIEHVSVDDILRLSENFPIIFGSETTRCKSLRNSVPSTILERNINSAYPVIHEKVLHLIAKFILHKRQSGSRQEQDFYKEMSVLQLVERLLTKRAVVFVGRNDYFVLMDRSEGSGKWDTSDENPNFLQNRLSYDELKLSAFLSVTSYTYFINDGSRYNKGVAVKERQNIEPEGVIIGLIGARTEKRRVMEYEEIVVSAVQNTAQNGYGDKSGPSIHTILADFYQEPCFTYGEALKLKETQPERFASVRIDEYIDNVAFSKRIALSIDTLLLEANQRAKNKNTTAFVYVVGIGLGVWKLSNHQVKIFVDTFAKRIEVLGTHLQSVSDIYFAYMSSVTEAGGYKHNEVIPIATHPKSGIKILMGKRQPHEKLRDENEGKLLVVSYAWDGNALPGNEYWVGNLDSSGDPAAAASTQIPELHNPHINKRVCSDNLHVATPKGVFPIKTYVETVKKYMKALGISFD